MLISRRVGFEKPVMGRLARCGGLVFVDQSAEELLLLDVCHGAGYGSDARLGGLERKDSVAPVPVEVLDVGSEYGVEVAAVQDQDAVEAFTSITD